MPSFCHSVAPLKGEEARVTLVVASLLRVHMMIAFRKGMLRLATAQSWGEENARPIRIVQRLTGG